MANFKKVSKFFKSSHGRTKGSSTPTKTKKNTTTIQANSTFYDQQVDSNDLFIADHEDILNAIKLNNNLNNLKKNSTPSPKYGTRKSDKNRDRSRKRNRKNKPYVRLY